MERSKSPENHGERIVVLIVITFILILFSIIIHEYAHGLVAFFLGDRTAKNSGRLTMNPMKHIDWFGTIILPLMLYGLSKFSGGGVPVFGYAKPVPINPYNSRNPRLFGAIVGFAGPFSNFCLAFLSAALMIKLNLFKTELKDPLLLLMQVNLLLGIFNLVPIPPLDGSRILSFFLPEKIADLFDRLGMVGFIFVLLFLQTDLFRKIYIKGTELFFALIDKIF